jgi:hypothetical protein
MDSKADRAYPRLADPRRVVNIAEINPYAPRPYTFTEAALCLRDAVRGLGYSSEVHVNEADVARRYVVLGALPPQLRAVEQLDSDRTVVFNLEQLSTARVTGKSYVTWLCQWLVADYHRENVEWLHRESGGGQRAMELPLVPSGSIAWRADLPYEPSADVLFYGSPSNRRREIVRRLKAAGLTVEIAGAFAHELTPAIKRARVVLHVHFYASALFPIARVLQPVAQGVPIVCESSVFSPLSDWSRSGILFAPYDGLVDACQALAASQRERGERAEANRAFAQSIDFATPFEALLQALERKPPVTSPAAMNPPAPMLVPRPPINGGIVALSSEDYT